MGAHWDEPPRRTDPASDRSARKLLCRPARPPPRPPAPHPRCAATTCLAFSSVASSFGGTPTPWKQFRLQFASGARCDGGAEIVAARRANPRTHNPPARLRPMHTHAAPVAWLPALPTCRERWLPCFCGTRASWAQVRRGGGMTGRGAAAAPAWCALCPGGPCMHSKRWMPCAAAHIPASCLPQPPLRVQSARL